MSNENNKDKAKYSLKEQIAYHKNMADKGLNKDNKALSTTQRVNHAIKAIEKQKKQNSFMKGVEFGKKIGK